MFASKAQHTRSYSMADDATTKDKDSEIEEDTLLPFYEEGFGQN